MIGLINGKPTLELADSEISIAILEHRGYANTRLRAQCSGIVSWTSEFDGPGPDPTASGRGFCGLVWARAGLLILAGYRHAVVISLDSGSVLNRISLEFAGAADYLEAALFEHQDVAVVASTRRLVFIGPDAEATWTEPFGPCREIGGVVGGELRLKEYDTDDPALPTVERGYDLPNAR